MQLLKEYKIILTKEEYESLSEKLKGYLRNNFNSLDDDFVSYCENEFDYRLWEELKDIVIWEGSVKVKIEG